MKPVIKSCIATGLLLLLPVTFSPTAIALSGESPGTTDSAPQIAQTITGDPAHEVAKKILQDEMQMARSNLLFRLNATKQGRWKGWRYFGFQEAGAALTMSGLILGVAERMKHIHDDKFKLNYTGTLMHGNVLAAVGQILAGYGSMQEFLINGYHSFDRIRNGYSPGQARRRATDLVSSINTQLADFHQLADSERAQGKLAEAEVHQKEAVVMADIRDMLVAEFDQYKIGSKRLLWQQQSFYILDTAKNAIGAVGNLYGYKALRQHNRNFNQPAGVLITVSGAMIMVDPILSRVCGKMACELDRYLLNKSGLKKTATTLAKTEADSKDLNDTVERLKDEHNPALGSSIRRVGLYSVHCRMLDHELADRAKDVRRGNRVAIQNVLSGAFVGGTKLTNGIMFDIAGFSYPRDARMTNAMIGIGSIPYLAGSAYSVGDNLRIQVLAEINRAKAKKNGTLQTTIIKKDLEQLDTLQKQIDTL